MLIQSLEGGMMERVKDLDWGLRVHWLAEENEIGEGLRGREGEPWWGHMG